RVKVLLHIPGSQFPTLTDLHPRWRITNSVIGLTVCPLSEVYLCIGLQDSIQPMFCSKSGQQQSRVLFFFGAEYLRPIALAIGPCLWTRRRGLIACYGIK